MDKSNTNIPHIYINFIIKILLIFNKIGEAMYLRLIFDIARTDISS